MMKFMYDSLETVKKLKHPTQKDFIRITVSVFLAIIVAGLLFVAADTIFSGLYKRAYNLMK